MLATPISMMAGWSECRLGHFVRAVCAAALVALVQFPSTCRAEPIIVADIEYTHDGSTDEEGRAAIETYLRFFLNKRYGGRVESIADYIRYCNSGRWPKSGDDSCPLPDTLLRLQIVERQDEIQISGTVGKRTEPKVLHPTDLGTIRVKVRDLTDGLAHIATRIEAMTLEAATPTERSHIVIACFGSGSEDLRVRRPQPALRKDSQTAARSPLSEYAEQLSETVESFLRNQPRFRVSKRKLSGPDCSSPERLEAVVKAANADAVLIGRTFSDDQGGVFALPQILIAGADKRIYLRPSKTLETPVQVGQRLATATNALVNRSERGELVKAIEDGTEYSYYVNRAKGYLSSSLRTDYTMAYSLLDLALWKAPNEPQAYLMLASSLADRMRYREADEILRSGLRQVADVRTLHLALAENAVRAGDLAGARKIYKDAMDLNALGEEGFIGIAKTYLLARPPDQSLALEYALKAATPHNTSSVDAYGLAGQIALAMKNFEGAEKYFTEALSLAPSSEEIVSRLSGLYERWSNEESIKGRLKEQIQHLTKSINLAPSVGKYFDRAFAQRRYFLKLGERQKAYELASGDFTSAREMASREDRLLTQFPWLMPNLAESLVFEGKFGSAKSVIQDLFLILGSESSMRTSIDRGDIRLIATFLNFVAEVLDAGSAEKELYLLENALLGRKFNRSSWSFAEMEAWLDKDYAKGGAELNPDERNQRVGAVRQVIGRIKVM